ncbi:MAG: TldD/PmbA family protein, partial [Candidatus Heimdallarchaeota archaeon]|nr:TldD/PmbA family protein [Candidatus Heimdallarchaeota archaeon]
MTDLEELAKEILTIAKSKGADHAQVSLTETKDIGSRFGESHITQNVNVNSLTFSLRTQIGNQVGIYHGSRPTMDSLGSKIDDALVITKHSVPDPDFPGFIDSQPIYRSIQRVSEDHDPEELAGIIGQIIETAHRVDSKITAVAGNFQFTKTDNYSLNTYDVAANNSNSRFGGVINIAATEGDGEARSTERFAGATLLDIDHQAIAQKVANRAKDGLNQQDMAIGKYEAILGHGSVVNLLQFIMFAASSEGLINHSSFLKDKIGEEIFDKRLTFTDDVANPKHTAARRYDSDLVNTEPISYVENGVLKAYAYNRRTGKKLGVESNGRNAQGFQGESPFFLTNSITPGTKTEDQLISEVDDGIYITNLFYNNFVNPPVGLCTGLTRDGLFRIKKGEIIGSLTNFRWTDSLLSIFKNAEPGN